MEGLFLQAIAIVIGASIGSFLNVVIYRIPAGLSILYPPSRCPHCLTRLAPRDNIPILGWFFIRGKCRHCHSPVSWRYPAIEAITALLFWCVAAYFGFSLPLVTLMFYCLFLSWLLALSVIDIDTMTLPNPLTQSGLIVGLVFQATVNLDGGATLWSDRLLTGITGAVLGLWLLDILRWLGRFILEKEAMGAGDAKLAAMIGAWLGWQPLLLTILVAAALGSLIGIGAIALGKLGNQQVFPFGPFLAVGGVISLFFGKLILTNYLGWFGLT